MGIFKDEIILNPLGTTEGYAGVIEEAKAEVDKDEFGDRNKPERNFKDIVYIVDHDSRLSLSNDTWAELLLGTGLVVNGKNKGTVKKVKEWLKSINFDEKLEDGVTNFYIKAGNMLFEKYPMMADIQEIDLRTVDGVKRDSKGKITHYIQKVNNKENEIPAKDVVHFKFSSRTGDVWGKPLANSIIQRRWVDGRERASPVEEMWEVENAMIKIFQSYASPMMMIHFKDAGENFIKKTERKMKKAGQGSKILTDKEFEAKVFEVNPASKFDKYIEHLEKDVIETGGQFATQMLTAGFTARASSESAGDVIKLKIKRKQSRLGQQIKDFIVDPYLRLIGKDPAKEDITCGFTLNTEESLSVTDIQGLFEKGTLKRSEIRQHLDKNTNIEIDTDDMADNPPITSVTPTNKLGQPTGDAAAQLASGQGQMVTIPQESLEKFITVISEKLPAPRGRHKEGRQEDIDKMKMKVLETLLKEAKREDELL
ncbi:MAG: hypothetical protein ACE5Q4_02720 [Nitrosopumilus sp.]